MKSYRKELSIYLPSRRGLVNLTGRVEQALQQSGIREGLVLVNSMDLTASVFMCPDESGLHQEPYHHNTYEQNGDAHLKRLLLGRDVTIAVSDGRLDLGRWEQVFFFEFDGMKEKHVLIKVIGE